MKAELSQAGFHCEMRDFFSEPLSSEELQHILSGDDPSELFSWRSPSFRKLGLDKSELTPSRMLELMLSEPRLIKRPIVVYGDQRLIAAEWKKLLQ